MEGRIGKVLVKRKKCGKSLMKIGISKWDEKENNIFMERLIRNI